MPDKEVIENLVDFLCDEGVYHEFISYMKDKGYNVVEGDCSNYITITE